MGEGALGIMLYIGAVSFIDKGHRRTRWKPPTGGSH